MKICCPNCSEVLESPVVPQEGQHLLCPFCNTKFLYSIRMSMLKAANRVGAGGCVATNIGGEFSKSDSNLSSLIECPDCRHSVSKRAKICPNCGAPLVREAEISPSRRYAALLFAIFFGLLGWHHYYLGYKRRGNIQLALFFVPFLLVAVSVAVNLDFLGQISLSIWPLMWIWGIFEVCAYSTDGEGRRLEW